MLGVAVQCHQHPVTRKGGLDSTCNGRYEQNRRPIEPGYLLGDSAEHKPTNTSTAMGTHHDQIRSQLTHMLDDAAGHIIGFSGVHMPFDGHACGKDASGDFIQVGDGLRGAGQMPLSMDFLLCAALNDMKQGDLRFQGVGKINSGRKRCFRHVRTVKGNQEMFEHVATPL